MSEDQEFSFVDYDGFTVGAGEGENGRGEYTDWVALIREVQSPRFGTIEDFLPDAIVEDPDQREMFVQYLELGKTQLHAPVNNRRSELRRLKGEIKLLDLYLENGELPDEPDDEEPLSWELREMVDYLEISAGTDDEKRQSAEEHRSQLQAQVATLYESIQSDKAEGQFRDYGELKEMFATMADGRGQIGSLTLKLPEFIARAFTAAKATETNTRRGHAQSVMSRQVYDAVTKAAATVDDSSRGRRRKRRRRFREEDDD